MTSQAGPAWGAISGVTSGSFASSQFFLVKSTAVSSNGDPIIALSIGSSGTNAATLGVIQDDATDSQPCNVVVDGPTKVMAGGVITPGAPLATSTAGTAIAAGTTGQYVWGRAISGASASGLIFDALVRPRGIWAGSTA